MQTSSALPSALATSLEQYRAAAPLVHCLTNVVVTNFTANVVLASGGAPAMVDNPQEAAEFAAIASGVLVNVGTPQQHTVEAMRLAAASAHEHGVPWVLDPVAAGGIGWRTGVAIELLEHRPTIVRGNASEILGLLGGAGGKGWTRRTPLTTLWSPRAGWPPTRGRSSRSAARRTTSPTAPGPWR
nr:hydroxyethylthiazole kinase [Raineyella fluvialis]